MYSSNCKVWWEKCDDMYRVTGILNQNEYHSILLHHASPPGTRLIHDNFVLKEDNDTKHTSQLCETIYRRKLVKKVDCNEMSSSIPRLQSHRHWMELIGSDCQKSDNQVLMKSSEVANYQLIFAFLGWKNDQKVFFAVIRPSGGYFDWSKI